MPSAIPPVTPPPPSVNGQNGHGPNGQIPSGQGGQEVPAGGAPLPPGHYPNPQLPGAGEVGPTPTPPRGPDFR